MKILIPILLIAVLIYGCSKDEETAPQILDAPTVTNILVSDVGNNGDGRDLEISFSKVENETLISEYRVFVVKSNEAGNFDLVIAQGIVAANYEKLVPDGTNKKLSLNDISTDTGGILITESIEYVVFVLTIVDGVNATGINALSSPSTSITLEFIVVDAPEVENIAVNYITTYGDGRDLKISFSKVSNETLVSEYRVFVVKASNQASFNLAMAESVSANDYASLTPDGFDVKINLNGSSTDVEGNIIDKSIEYVAFALSIIDGVKATGSNSLSTASSGITLLDINFEMYVSDAGNFNSPPWQILKFDRAGQNGEVFINSNLNWPQDIIFIESSNEVLISNLGSNTITKHNATTGAYIEDFATSIGGPTRMKIGPDDLLYVLQWNGNGNVFRYNLDGTFIDEFTSVGVTQSIGIDWDSDGNIYVSSWNGGSVRKFDTNGDDQGLFINSDLAGPTNIWFDNNGDLLVSDYNGTSIKRFDSSGNFKSDYITGLSSSEGIAFFPEGNIFIGNGATNSVKMFNNDGDFIKDFIPNGTLNLINPNAVIIREIP